MGEVKHRPHPGAQEDFLSTSVDECFTGGEAGGGKSWALCQDFLYDIDNPNANGILFRRTFPDLEDLIFKAQNHYAGFDQHYNSSKHLFTFASGARFRFSHLQHANDIFTHAGQEYTHIYWDEICHFPKLPYVFLMSRMRTTDATLRPRVRSTGNPDGEGVLWVKARYIDQLEPYEVGWFKTENDRDSRATPEQEKELFMLARLPMEERVKTLLIRKDLQGFLSRQWIPTVRAQNKALMNADPDYEARLDQLPESQKKAYKFGVWAQTDQPFQLVSTQWLQDALNGVNEVKEGNGAVGADYAETQDRCTLVSGRGNQVLRIKEFPGMSTNDFASIVFKEHMRYGKEQCYTGVDSVGPGVGVFHNLQEMGLNNLDGSRYKDPNFSASYDTGHKLKFNNWRSQACWQLAEDFKNGDIDLSFLQTKEGYFDGLHLLQEEILSHKYDVKNGVMHITPKSELRKPENLGRSPDLWDALVIWNWVRRRELNSQASGPKKEVDYGYFKKKVIHTPRTGSEAWT